jgi:hypothetical protein
MSSISTEIESIVREFTARVVAAAKVQASERVLSAVSAALTGQAAVAPASSAKPQKAAAVAAVPAKRKLKLSAKGLAARKLQGQYLGLLRGLGPGPRARVKKVAREKGVAEALKFAASLK